MFGSIGMPELIIILMIALIIFGPRKLPELGRSLGKSLGEFKRASNELRNTLDEEIRIEERTQRVAKPATPSRLGHRLGFTEPPPRTHRRGRTGPDRSARNRSRVGLNGARSVPRAARPAVCPRRRYPLIELTDPDEIELDGGRMSFLEHLDELRKRLIAGLIGLVVGCVIAFFFLDTYIVPFIMVPMEQMLPQGGTLITPSRPRPSCSG